jgi:anaerobic magnesium-protoporphyrin IX monomethyl ester cyclase
MKTQDIIIVEPKGVDSNVFADFLSLPLMGPVYLGTILQRRGHRVRVLNENLMARQPSWGAQRADVLMVSCLSSTAPRGYMIADEFRAANPKARVIFGGPHVTFMKEEALEHCDHVFLGEAEDQIVDLVEYGSDEPFIQGSPVQDLDTIPLPDFSLLADHKRMTIGPVMTSRGCPHACDFCSVTSMFGRKYRTNSVDRVLEEVRRSPHQEIFFYDDHFAANTARTHQVVDGLLAMNKRPKWTAQMRADVTRDRELISKMAAAGITRVYIGFESVNQDTLDAYQKHQKVDDIVRAIDVFHRHGIRIHGMFMFGAEHDNLDTIRQTVDFVHRHHIDTVQFLILTPLPGTATFARLEQEGRLLHKDWRYYDTMHVVFKPAQFTPYQLQQHMVESFETFYSFAGATVEALNALHEAGLGLVGAIGRKMSSSTLTNLAVKIGGKHIVRSWRKSNRDYLTYLKSLDVTDSNFKAPFSST